MSFHITIYTEKKSFSLKLEIGISAIVFKYYRTGLFGSGRKKKELGGLEVGKLEI